MSYRFSNPLIVALTAAVPFSGAHAENWPQFRGPTHQGLSSERSAPLHWNATTNVAWKTEIPGEGWSSPIVWNDRIFVTTATEGEPPAGSSVSTARPENWSGSVKSSASR